MKDTLHTERTTLELIAFIALLAFGALLSIGLFSVGFKTAELQQGSALPVKAGRK